MNTLRHMNEIPTELKREEEVVDSGNLSPITL